MDYRSIVISKIKLCGAIEREDKCRGEQLAKSRSDGLIDGKGNENIRESDVLKNLREHFRTTFPISGNEHDELLLRKSDSLAVTAA